MTNHVDQTSLHRTAKYFMDSGHAQTHDEAMAMLEGFGLTVHVGAELATSIHHQNALITLINVARRTLLGGIHIVGLPSAMSLSPLAPGRPLEQAVTEMGGQLVTTTNDAWPSVLIGDTVAPSATSPCWRITWAGWRGGVAPRRDAQRLQETDAMPLAPLVAAACCAAEAFAYHASDHAMAGRRAVGMSLWHPGRNWLTGDTTEPILAFLPSQLWFIGLGNLGQAYAWTLATLPFEDRAAVQLILNDFDRIAASNESTSLLSFASDIGRKKTRVVADWLEERGFTPALEERHYGPWIKRAPHEPAVALAGVDNALARTALEESGFGLVADAGLGAGPEAFRSISVHTFPASRSAQEIWSRQVGQGAENVESMPAYKDMKRKGMDSCGLAQLASRTVGVPFVGLIAACLVQSELLRRLNGGCALELVSGSVASPGDFETVSMPSAAYAFGHQAVANSSATSQLIDPMLSAA